ncbi:uncharacterized protein [Eucyclogobius newberryi]|uniref:uncharacterized protein n=1 Tax=Eucyclogobius newberryi TaxID=166745 RepID=UPI003B5B4A38
MTDPRRPFPLPPPSSSSASPTMHHCALPPAFLTSPPPHHHHHHQSNAEFINHSDQSHAQQHFTGQNLDTALESNDWSPAQFPSMLSSYTCPEQNWDLHPSSQNLFNSTAFNYNSFQSEVFHYPDPQCFQSNNFYSQITSPADLSHWGSLEPTTPQLQCSSLGYTSREATLGSWSSPDYNFTSNTDKFAPVYLNGYRENQSFLSPSTPGPSPHYPPSFLTSPTSENGTEKLGFQTFVDTGTFTTNNQNEVIQKQTKPKKTTRGRGGTRPRKSRTDKKKAIDSTVDVVAVMPPSLLQRSDVEEEEPGPVCHRKQSRNRSLMRLITNGDQSHFRPPPILSPIRAGAGLHWSVAEKCSTVLMETASLETLTSETTPPCINIGQSFQAEIPPLKNRRHAHSDSHNAQLLWRPLKELEPSTNQQRVEALLKFARSSAVPAGGANPEEVLLLLSQNRGDFLLTLEKLLTFPKSSNKRLGPRRHSSITPNHI